MNKKTKNLNLFNWLFKYINLSFLTSNEINNQSISKISSPEKSFFYNSRKDRNENQSSNIVNQSNSNRTADRSFDSFTRDFSESNKEESDIINDFKSDNTDYSNSFLPKKRVLILEPNIKDQKDFENFKKSSNIKDKIQKNKQNSKFYSNTEFFNENINADSSVNKKKLSYKEKFNTSSSKSRFIEASKQQVVSITYEEIGLFPRSFNRVFDRFFKQLFFDVENLVIQEYRFYRYLFLTTVKCVFILLFVPLTINFIAKNYFVRPITEYYWNSHQMEIFLNSYQQKKAFTELKNFEEKIYFESLIFPMNQNFSFSSCLPENLMTENLSFDPTIGISDTEKSNIKNCSHLIQDKNLVKEKFSIVKELKPNTKPIKFNENTEKLNKTFFINSESNHQKTEKNEIKSILYYKNFVPNLYNFVSLSLPQSERSYPSNSSVMNSVHEHDGFDESDKFRSFIPSASFIQSNREEGKEAKEENIHGFPEFTPSTNFASSTNFVNSLEERTRKNHDTKESIYESGDSHKKSVSVSLKNSAKKDRGNEFPDSKKAEILSNQILDNQQTTLIIDSKIANINEQEKINQNSKFSQMFTQSIQKRLQLQTVELAKHYNEESIEAITNFFADLISLSTLFVLLKLLEIQINITKSFLLEVFFGLDDSKKSLLILFITDLLVGYHSPNIWELFFSTIFDHYGLPESQTTIFLLVATLPVLLDVLFKYLIFRHLNRASPATVATYHAMIE